MYLCLSALIAATLFLPDSAQGTCPQIVSRTEWGARQPKGRTPIKEPVPHVFIHHTATPSCSTQQECSQLVRSIQKNHMDKRGWDDIGYNFLGGDGKIYEGRGWDLVGAQVLHWNFKSVGISFIGNFMTSLPTAGALQICQDMIACGVSSNKLSATYELHGHRDAAATDCPGDALYKLINGWPHYKKCYK